MNLSTLDDDEIVLTSKFVLKDDQAKAAKNFSKHSQNKRPLSKLSHGQARTQKVLANQQCIASLLRRIYFLNFLFKSSLVHKQ